MGYDIRDFVEAMRKVKFLRYIFHKKENIEYFQKNII